MHTEFFFCLFVHELIKIFNIYTVLVINNKFNMLLLFSFNASMGNGLSLHPKLLIFILFCFSILE